jgi:hypothetical protein
MSVRAEIIEVSCPPIHAVAYGTSNPKILTGNDKDVMPPHFERGCDVFATRRVEPMKTIYFAFCLWCCEQENSSPACISVILPTGHLKRKNAYQHFRPHAPRTLYRAVKSCSNCRNSAGSNRPVI